MERKHIARVGTYHKAGAQLTGYVLPTCGVWSTLDDELDVVCTTAGTYYPIEGVTTTEPLDGFSVDTDTPAGVVLDPTGCPGEYMVMAHLSVVKSSGTSLLKFGVLLNGVLVSRSIMPTTVTVLALCMPAIVVPYLNPGDKVSLAISSSNDADTVTIKALQATITRFTASPE